MGDRPIQVSLLTVARVSKLTSRKVGSHYHFTETNRALVFDRSLALFRRLDIAAGTAIRFEPGDSKTVTLVDISGHRVVSGGNLLVNTAAARITTQMERDSIIARLVKEGFGHEPQLNAKIGTDVKGFELSREGYTSMYGPTTGDRVRLGDTALWIEVEKDLCCYGDELKFGGGKVIREGMGQATGLPDEETLDLVLTNALIVDWSGIYKVSFIF